MNPDHVSGLIGQPLEQNPLFELGQANWRPALGSSEFRLAIHVCQTGEIGAAIQRRIRLALQLGIRVVVVIEKGLLSIESSSQAFLLSVPVSIISVKDPVADVLTLYRDMAAAVVDEELLLDEQIATHAIADRLDEAIAAAIPEKGEALEQALTLALSQVPGWVIHDVRRRTANEELDIIIANNSARSPWNGSSLVLVEAKNWSGNVDRVEYDALHMKIQERGGLVRIGFLVAATGFSTGFLKRAASFGTHGISIVPVVIPKLLEELRAGKGIEKALSDRVLRVAIDRVWEE